MNLKRRLLRLIADAAYSTTRMLAPAAYAQDGLISVHTHDFMQEPRFLKAYARGVKALGGTDRYVWHWRAHIGLWAADQAARLDGDFIECGVNYGFLSSAIMEWLDWNTLDKRFYLLDTFSGLDPRYVTASEASGDAMTKNREHLADGFYVSGVESVQRNFAQWPSARIIQGTVPETLAQVDTERIAFAHIDMNCAPPEIAAAEFIWPRMVPGAMMLFDDYAYFGFPEQHAAIDDLARRLGVTVCTLPTGQGLLIKPGR